MAMWHVQLADGQQVGPVDLDTLRDYLRTRKIHLQSWVCPEGQQQWIPAGQVVGLVDLSATLPQENASGIDALAALAAQASQAQSADSALAFELQPDVPVAAPLNPSSPTQPGQPPRPSRREEVLGTINELLERTGTQIVRAGGAGLPLEQQLNEIKQIQKKLAAARQKLEIEQRSGDPDRVAKVRNAITQLNQRQRTLIRHIGEFAAQSGLPRLQETARQLAALRSQAARLAGPAHAAAAIVPSQPAPTAGLPGQPARQKAAPSALDALAALAANEPVRPMSGPQIGSMTALAASGQIAQLPPMEDPRATRPGAAHYARAALPIVAAVCVKVLLPLLLIAALTYGAWWAYQRYFAPDPYQPARQLVLIEAAHFSFVDLASLRENPIPPSVANLSIDDLLNTLRPHIPMPPDNPIRYLCTLSGIGDSGERVLALAFEKNVSLEELLTHLPPVRDGQLTKASFTTAAVEGTTLTPRPAEGPSQVFTPLGPWSDGAHVALFQGRVFIMATDRADLERAARLIKANEGARDQAGAHVRDWIGIYAVVTRTESRRGMPFHLAPSSTPPIAHIYAARRLPDPPHTMQSIAGIVYQNSADAAQALPEVKKTQDSAQQTARQASMAAPTEVNLRQDADIIFVELTFDPPR